MIGGAANKRIYRVLTISRGPFQSNFSFSPYTGLRNRNRRGGRLHAVDGIAEESGGECAARAEARPAADGEARGGAAAGSGPGGRCRPRGKGPVFQRGGADAPDGADHLWQPVHNALRHRNHHAGGQRYVHHRLGGGDHRRICLRRRHGGGGRSALHPGRFRAGRPD